MYSCSAVRHISKSQQASMQSYKGREQSVCSKNNSCINSGDINKTNYNNYNDGNNSNSTGNDNNINDNKAMLLIITIAKMLTVTTTTTKQCV